MSSNVSEKLKIYQHLTTISMELAYTLDLDTLLKRIVSAAVEITNSRAGSILLLDVNENQLQTKVTSGSQNDTFIQSVVVPMESVAGWVASHKIPVIIPDVKKDPRYSNQMAHGLDFPIQSLIAIPLFAKNKLIGVLELFNKNQNQFDEDDQNALTILGAQAAVSIENARLFNQADLISELVHELKTPLTSIATITYLLQRSDVTEDQRKMWTGTILNEIQRLNTFATNFLDLAHLESGRTILNREPANIILLLRECLEVIIPKANDSGIKITEEFLDILPPIYLDKDKIKQVFLNLLCNAIKYCPKNGEIVVSTGRQNNELVVTIEDNGLGIHPEDIPYIFEKYYRGKHSENNTQGYGLGLSICKRIINAHDGIIEVFSTLGKGTRFVITLPIGQI